MKKIESHVDFKNKRIGSYYSHVLNTLMICF